VTRLTFLTVLAIGCSPAAAPAVAPSPKVVTPPAKSATANAPTRVLFPFHEFREVTALDLGDGAQLKIGATGRRALAKNGKLEEGLPMPEPIRIATRVADGIALIADSGMRYLVKEPLGHAVELHGGPTATERPRSFAHGKSAVAIAIASGVFRSLDGGRTWKASTFDVASGAAISVALTKDGHGLALKVPQRLFTTTDDGATWKAIDSLGLGARSVSADSSTLRVDGALGSARLVDGKLVREPAAAVSSAPAGSSSWSLARLYGGFLVVDEHLATGGLAVRIGALGDALKSTDAPCQNTHGAGDDSGVYLVCDDDHGTLHHWTPKDGWKQLSQRKGRTGDHETAVAVSNGVLWVGRLCEEEACGNRKVSFDGKTFADLKVDAHGAVRAVAFDAKQRGYLVADDGGRLGLYTSEPSSPTFTRTKMLDLDVARWSRARVTVDEDQALHVATCLESFSGCVVHTFRNGAPAGKRELPGAYDVALVGKRGMMVGLDGLAHETADGGATWTLASFPGDREDLTCSAHGCLRYETLRLGWGEPGSDPSELDPNAKIEEPAPPKMKAIACKPTGPAVSHVVPRDILEARDGLGWIEAKMDGAFHAKLASGGVVRDVEVLAPTKAKGVTVDARVRAGVVVRFTRKDEAAAPDVEVAWLPNGKAKPVHAQFKAPQPFAPEPHRDVAVSRALGGVILRVGDKSVFHIDDKGHAKPLSDVAPLESFARVGKHFVSALLGYGSVVELAWPSTARIAWTLAQYGQSPPHGQLVSTPTGAVIAFEEGEHAVFADVPESSASDPISLFRADAREILGAMRVCGDEGLVPIPALSASSELADREVRVEGLAAPVAHLRLSVHPIAKSPCGMSLLVQDEDHRVHIPLGAPASAWLIEKESLRPISCTLP